MDEWDRRWFSIAKTYASFSKDPSTKVGAVAVKDRREISAGWNGFPRGILDDTRMNNRESKYAITVHAEQNCIYNAAYVGVSLKDCTLYVYGLPICSECVKGVLQVGVKLVKIGVLGEVPERWEESFNISKARMLEASVQWEVHDVSSL
jgi:dCMP deaminase